MEDVEGWRWKLAHLEQLIPNEPEVLYEFCRYLEARLGPHVRPVGFVMGYFGAIEELKTGLDRTTKTQISDPLVGRSCVTYIHLQMALPRVLEAAFPKQFARTAQDTLKFIEVSRTQ